VSSFADFSNSLTDDERLQMILAGDPRMSAQRAEKYLETLRERFGRKQEFRARGFSNQLAEKALDKEGWPRPFGWRTVFFYPDSTTPRTRYLVVFIAVVAFVFWKFAPYG
jgi:hypothetical protein